MGPYQLEVGWNKSVRVFNPSYQLFWPFTGVITPFTTGMGSTLYLKLTVRTWKTWHLSNLEVIFLWHQLNRCHVLISGRRTLCGEEICLFGINFSKLRSEHVGFWRGYQIVKTQCKLRGVARQAATRHKYMLYCNCFVLVSIFIGRSAENTKWVWRELKTKETISHHHANDLMTNNFLKDLEKWDMMGCDDMEALQTVVYMMW